MTGRARRVTTRVALVGVASLLLLECTTRVWLFGPAGLNPARVNSLRPIFQDDILMPAEDPAVGFRLRPNLDIWFKLARLRTSGLGLPYYNLFREKQPGVFRVAVMGSSFTLRSVMANVPVERTFPLYSPTIKEMEIVERRKVRRAKLYYLRDKPLRYSRV